MNLSKNLILIILLQFCIGFTRAQNTGSISGNVLDAKSGDPLIGATISLDNTNMGSVTDINGKYSIENIPANTYNITCNYLGYNQLTKFNIIIRSTGNRDIDFELAESPVELNSVTVTPNPFQKNSSTPLSIQSLSQEEISSYPGGNNDIAKVVQSLPGISNSVGGFRNDVIIRGGAPNENVYYLDGIEIPSINHFSTQGSAGGPVGLLNVSFFENVTLSSSAFGAQYDNVLSGVLQFDQRNGNPREFVGNFRLSSSEAALTMEAPLFKGDSYESSTTVIASVRRSYLQFLFKLIGLPFLPDYWDYQYKVNHKVNSYNDIYLTGVGSIDGFSVNQLDNFDPEQQALQDQVPVIEQRTNTIGLGWRKRFKDNSGILVSTISSNILNNRFSQYQDNINETGLFFQNDSREIETRLRSTLTKFMDNWTAQFGFILVNSDYQNRTVDSILTRTFQSKLNFFRYGLFVQASSRLANDRLGISFGLRVDGNSFTNNGNEIYRTFSPRFSISYNLDKAGKWAINTSAGRYYKILPYTALGFKDNDGNFVNKSSDYIQSDHFAAGIEYLVYKSARISIEGFFKRYANYPVSITDGVSLANKGGGFEVFGSEPVSSKGIGRTYGLELLFQQKFTGKFYGIAALTLYKSEFSGADTSLFIPSVWDNGVLVSLLGGYQFGKNWDLSARFRLSGKAPYAPVDQEATLANYPAIIKNYSALGTVRLGTFSQLDLRIGKKWSFKRLSLDLYLEIENLTGQAIPAEPQFGLNRNEQGEIIVPESLVQVNLNGSGSVLPSLGIVLNF